MRDIDKKKKHDAKRHAERYQADLDYRLRMVLNAIRHRCRPDSGQPYYAGLPVDITLADLRYLWERDNAAEQDQPSIDREDETQGYHLDNCRFIPFSENRSRAFAKRDESKKVQALKATIAKRPTVFCSKHPDRPAARSSRRCNSCRTLAWRASQLHRELD